MSLNVQLGNPNPSPPAPPQTTEDPLSSPLGRRIEHIKKFQDIAKWQEAAKDHKTGSDEYRALLDTYSKGMLFRHLNPNSSPRNSSSTLNILFFGATGSGRAAFFNNVVTGYKDLKTRSIIVPEGKVLHSHSERLITKRVNCWLTTIGNINFIKPTGNIWLDSDQDIMIITQLFLGMIKIQRYKTEAEIEPINLGRCDLIVFTISATANQREVDYMRVLSERLIYSNIPHAFLASKTKPDNQADNTKHPMDTFRAPCYLRCEHYSEDSKIDDVRNSKLLEIVIKLVKFAEETLGLDVDSEHKTQIQDLIQLDTEEHNKQNPQ